MSRLFEKDRVSSFGRFVPPCIAELEYNSSRGTEFVLNSHFTPAEEGTVEIYTVFFVRRTRMPMVAKRLLLTPFFRRILTQDSRILSLQQRNIHRLGSIHYTYWQADLLRPLIEAWIENGKFPEGYAEHTVHLNM